MQLNLRNAVVPAAILVPDSGRELVAGGPMVPIVVYPLRTNNFDNSPQKG
jgi:hypothetical protein